MKTKDEPLISNKEWQDKCRELRKSKEYAEILEARIKNLESTSMEWQTKYAILFDKTQGTPCEQIRWQQEKEQLLEEYGQLKNELSKYTIKEDGKAERDYDDSSAAAYEIYEKYKNHE